MNRIVPRYGHTVLSPPPSSVDVESSQICTLNRCRAKTAICVPFAGKIRIALTVAKSVTSRLTRAFRTR